MDLGVDHFIAECKRSGYAYFKEVKGKPLNLNLVGWRNKNARTDYFDDFVSLYWQEGSKWMQTLCPATTRPGLPWLLRPIVKDGAAILVPGQYIGAYELGAYRGYTALKQCKTLKVYRDNNRDSVVDVDPATISQGDYGIHIHRASFFQKAIGGKIGRYSAGCQVVERREDFETLIALCVASSLVWGNSFTYTLLEF